MPGQTWHLNVSFADELEPEGAGSMSSPQPRDVLGQIWKEFPVSSRVPGILS